ncbi:hypothetical protein HAX54_038041 [Datura stramonium]|uniref:NADH dehydrogenase [ubiquinone] iron-sulfur protein 4, mitochondrial n=1 Tax=Datura stramonium TaxID=4076 RepID=A0ABS8SHP9_DATST|nr:hypothetical protein [Datura stramonium]
MASFLRRPFTRFQHLQSSRVCSTRFSSSSYSSDALVEIKPREVGMVSGILQEHLRRRVIIYSPTRTATQQGSGKHAQYLRSLNRAIPKTARLANVDILWENPLIRWTSTGDPLSYVGEAGLSFDSLEAAKTFSEKHGWEYTVKKFHAPLL